MTASSMQEIAVGLANGGKIVSPPGDSARPRVEVEPLLDEAGDIRVDGQSVPRGVAMRAGFWHTVRTVGPFALSDIAMLTLSACWAYAAMWALGPAHAPPPPAGAPLVLLPVIIGYWLSELYSEIWVHPVVELRQLTHMTTFGLLAAAAGGAWAGAAPVWCLLAGLAAIVLTPMGRAITRKVCSSQSWWGYPTLLICSGEDFHAFARTLLGSQKSGLRPVMMTDPFHACRSSVLPVINDQATLESLIRVEGIRHAVVSLPEMNSADMSAALDRYGGLVPHLLVLSDCATLPSLWGASRSCGRLSGIEVRNSLLLATLSIGKRVVDLGTALLILTLTLPLTLLLIAAVRMSSPGPVFYGHQRIGRHGRLFRAWKFRTMFANSDDILREHLARSDSARIEWERQHKLRDDPRVTWLGKILRRTSMDELPQLWNVLLGDMSLVGPRPIVRSEARRYRDVFGMYTSVKPGVTGLWQVSGRTDVGYHDRVLLDQFYIRHWSPWLDIYILARTIITLVRCRGAY